MPTSQFHSWQMVEPRWTLGRWFPPRVVPAAAPPSGHRTLPEFRLSPHLLQYLHLNSMAYVPSSGPCPGNPEVTQASPWSARSHGVPRGHQGSSTTSPHAYPTAYALPSSSSLLWEGQQQSPAHRALGKNAAPQGALKTQSHQSKRQTWLWREKLGHLIWSGQRICRW